MDLIDRPQYQTAFREILCQSNEIINIKSSSTTIEFSAIHLNTQINPTLIDRIEIKFDDQIIWSIPFYIVYHASEKEFYPNHNKTIIYLNNVLTYKICGFSETITHNGISSMFRGIPISKYTRTTIEIKADLTFDYGLLMLEYSYENKFEELFKNSTYFIPIYEYQQISQIVSSRYDGFYIISSKIEHINITCDNNILLEDQNTNKYVIDGWTVEHHRALTESLNQILPKEIINFILSLVDHHYWFPIDYDVRNIYGSHRSRSISMQRSMLEFEPDTNVDLFKLPNTTTILNLNVRVKEIYGKRRKLFQLNSK